MRAFLLTPFLVLIACGGGPVQKPNDPDRINATPEQEAAWRKLSNDPAVVAAGRDMYFSIDANCQTCHGKDGLGKRPFGPNLRDDQWIYGSDMANIIQSIAYGRNRGSMPMPGLKPRWSDEDIATLAAFVAHWNRSEKANGEGFRRRETETTEPIDY